MSIASGPVLEEAAFLPVGPHVRLQAQPGDRPLHWDRSAPAVSQGKPLHQGKGQWTCPWRWLEGRSGGLTLEAKVAGALGDEATVPVKVRAGVSGRRERNPRDRSHHADLALPPPMSDTAAPGGQGTSYTEDPPGPCPPTVRSHRPIRNCHNRQITLQQAAVAFPGTSLSQAPHHVTAGR